jgi:hypothetical protein
MSEGDNQEASLTSLEKSAAKILKKAVSSSLMRLGESDYSGDSIVFPDVHLTRDEDAEWMRMVAEIDVLATGQLSWKSKVRGGKTAEQIFSDGPLDTKAVKELRQALLVLCGEGLSCGVRRGESRTGTNTYELTVYTDTPGAILDKLEEKAGISIASIPLEEDDDVAYHLDRRETALKEQAKRKLNRGREKNKINEPDR